MKKVLVVGGAGYIGGLTTDYLLKARYKVTVYDRLLYESRYLKDVNFIAGDIRDTKKLIKISQKFDEIIWLAAIVGDGACAQSPELTSEVNLKSLIRFLNKTKRRIIFTSTCSVYGDQDSMLNEKSSTKPLSLYASTKLEAEKYVIKFGGLVFRLGTLFGLGDQFSRIRLDLVVNVLTLKAITDKKLTVFGGNQYRPIIAVKDVAQYLVEAVDSNAKGIYNIKYKNIKIIDLAKEIKQVFPNITIEKVKAKFQDLRNYRVDSKKANQTFKFRPNTTVKEEVLKMKKLFKQGRITNFHDNIYYNTHYVKQLIDWQELK